MTPEVTVNVFRLKLIYEPFKTLNWKLCQTLCLFLLKCKTKKKMILWCRKTHKKYCSTSCSLILDEIQENLDVNTSTTLLQIYPVRDVCVQHNTPFSYRLHLFWIILWQNSQISDAPYKSRRHKLQLWRLCQHEVKIPI